MDSDGRIIVVTGATGRQGGAVARHLRSDGWRVRGVTRTPDSQAARALAAYGVEVVRADMADATALRNAFAGAHGVYSVQNPMIRSDVGELEQGRNVVDAAAAAGVEHLVQGSAGPGVPGTGVAQWDDKLALTQYARSRGMPLTVLRPTAFMELMTDKDLYPAVAAWHLMPALAGENRPIPWLCADDLGAVAARVFADPGAWVGDDVALASDERGVAECRETWRRVTGRSPKRVRMPRWLFERFVGPDLPRMWRWLATHTVAVDIDATRALAPAALTVEEFIRRRARHGPG